MSDQGNKHSLEQLADSAAQGVREQQSRSAELATRQATPGKGKPALAAALVLACVGLLVYQAPRFSAPYDWPDPDRNPITADADLETVVGLIEVYRAVNGRLPDTLDQVRLPKGLAAVIAGTKLEYLPKDDTYKLDWTLPHWHATFASDTGRASVQPTNAP